MKESNHLVLVFVMCVIRRKATTAECDWRGSCDDQERFESVDGTRQGHKCSTLLQSLGSDPSYGGDKDIMKLKFGSSTFCSLLQPKLDNYL